MFEFEDFNKEINRFTEHDRSSEKLYNTFKEVFDRAVAKNKNSITMTGGLRDLSEAARSLSSIRGDGISATSHIFNIKLKVSELSLKRERSEKGDQDMDAAATLMRQLTETIHKQNIKNQAITNADFEDNSEEMFQQRLKQEIDTGKIALNINEKSMKYDFSGVTYRFDTENEIMVVLDKFGIKIDNYPLERIPEEYRFKGYDNGVPVDFCGREIKPYAS